MKRPYGLTDAHLPPIVELNEALHGLPNASQYFEEFLSTELLKLGFVHTISDQQLFVLRRYSVICYLSTSVDDFLSLVLKVLIVMIGFENNFLMFFNLLIALNLSSILV